MILKHDMYINRLCFGHYPNHFNCKSYNFCNSYLLTSVWIILSNGKKTYNPCLH